MTFLRLYSAAPVWDECRASLLLDPQRRRPHFCLDRDIAMGAGYVSATSEVVVVSADRALALPSTRPRRALRNKVLKTLQFKTFCPTLACNIPTGHNSRAGVSPHWSRELQGVRAPRRRRRKRKAYSVYSTIRLSPPPVLRRPRGSRRLWRSVNAEEQ